MTLARSRPMVRLGAALAAACFAAAALLLAASAASAHAMLVSVDPADGSDASEPPAEVRLTFDEPVEVPSDGLRVFDADAVRIDTGPTDDGDPTTVSVGLPDELPDGGYVVTYRVVSADSHPLAGVTTFTVGGAAAVDDEVVAELFGGAGRSVAGVAGPVLRGLGYAATLLAAGAVAVATVIARRDEHRRLARTVGVRAAVAGIVLTVLAVPVQGAANSGVGVLEAATSARILGEVMDSGFGEGTVVRALALLVLAVLWRRPSPALLVGIAAGGALGSYLRDGHQRTVEPSWLLIGGDALHLAAGAVWLGGLVLLALILRSTSRDDSPVAAARFVARFSDVALGSVLLLAASGVAMAWPLVGTPGALTSTTYGWLLLGKVSAVAAVVAVAVYNRQRLVPLVVAHAAPRGASTDVPASATDPDVAAEPRFARAWRALTAAVRLEVVVLLAVLLVTGFLVSQQPAADEAGLRGLYETTAAFGDDLEVDVVVDPNRAGRNTIHVYVIDPAGRPSDDVEDVTFELTYLPEDIGPIRIEPFFAGPGHWIATVDDLVFPGDWQLRVTAGVDRFTELSTDVTVPVAG